MTEMNEHTNDSRERSWGLAADVLGASIENACWKAAIY